MPGPPLASGSAHLRSAAHSVRRRTRITTPTITTATTTQPLRIATPHPQPRITHRLVAAGIRITVAITLVRRLRARVNANRKVGHVNRVLFPEVRSSVAGLTPHQRRPPYIATVSDRQGQAALARRSRGRGTC